MWKKKKKKRKPALQLELKEYPFLRYKILIHIDQNLLKWIPDFRKLNSLASEYYTPSHISLNTQI